jgi:hypothetical protein
MVVGGNLAGFKTAATVDAYIYYYGAGAHTAYHFFGNYNGRAATCTAKGAYGYVAGF